ncbi:hypothetical protein BV25DRAFT_1136479 [Artomyces pyxidatus]|uniref:Uncharacterized protein n=1 Tax=Artomyces pyxidatus TaxID=48021 RepID=A0ACB8SUM2_9AGAM|nr:hypothetical protein BV25DRAFT_1136479 [Artomyces pyxidatus]
MSAGPSRELASAIRRRAWDGCAFLVFWKASVASERGVVPALAPLGRALLGRRLRRRARRVGSVAWPKIRQPGCEVLFSLGRILALGTPTGQPWMPTTGRAGRVTGCSVKISAPSRLSSGCRRSQFGGGSVIVVTRTATLHRHRPADQGMDDPESRLCCDEIYSVVSIDWRALTLSAHGHSMPGTSTV